MKYRLRFIAVFCSLIASFLAMGAIAQSVEAPAESGQSLFAVQIMVGPTWDNSKAPDQQTFFKEHSAHLKLLREAGHIVMGARYSDKGLLIFSASSAEEVTTLMEQDPSMTAGTFVFEVHAFNVFYPGLVQAGSKPGRIDR